ncbi:MAG: aspartate-semialdehyde dehydrogenase [Erysipelothrix sp.]|nr:aspartate-semialdehyde dehydrogenase [Erysipelothrix sp.]
MINIALIGTTGMVGETIRNVLEERQLPIGEVYLFASKRSAGSVVEFLGKSHTIIELTEENIASKKIDIALMSAGGSISEHYAPLLVKQGAVVIDNSSVFRMNSDVPLIVPEVNANAIGSSNLISNPNCSTIQSVLPLKVLDDLYGIKRVVYSTYQAVSGSGVAGVADLENETTFNYPYQISNNILPHIDSFEDNGYTKEEMKMIEETRKILNKPDLRVTATTVRVPIVNTHAVNINVELEKDFDVEDVKAAMANYPGITLRDDVANNIYPLAENADGKDDVFVGRIRRDFSLEHGLNLWCVADNIRKGAATNTVQIAENIIKERNL